MTAIRDELIRTGVEAAITKTLDRAITTGVYPGHFTVTADGGHFGGDTTWPGLDSWELAGAYLLLGREQLVRDYFAFVRVSQRADGNIPFAIFPATAELRADGYLRGLKLPADIYTDPIVHRQWVGLFEHWQPQANPLSLLGPVSYILTAAEIFNATGSREWLRENLASIEAAARYVLSRRSPNGFLDGSGFYLECPPRNRWDGVTQCYGVQAFRLVAGLCEELGESAHHALWRNAAELLAESFRRVFWQGDHFAEYVHPERGVIDTHGLTDVNWAAIAWDVATSEQRKRVGALLLDEPAFWWGGMPTQLVTKPFTYEDWELPEPLPFEIPNPRHDVAAMGRVWYLETLACLKLGATDRVVESVRKVCAAGERSNWLWHERYYPQADGSVRPTGPHGYCEYAAILTRVVLGTPQLFAA